MRSGSRARGRRLGRAPGPPRPAPQAVQAGPEASRPAARAVIRGPCRKGLGLRSWFPLILRLLYASVDLTRAQTCTRQQTIRSALHLPGSAVGGDGLEPTTSSV